MTDKPDSPAISAARRALELKKAAASGRSSSIKTPSKGRERDAAHRSMSKSKPQLRK